MTLEQKKAKDLVDTFIPLVRWKMGQEDYKVKAKSCARIYEVKHYEETMDLLRDLFNHAPQFVEQKIIDLTRSHEILMAEIEKL